MHDNFSNGDISLYHGDVLDFYDLWDSPVVIISDGAYGLGLFEGDPVNPRELKDWYEPHVKKWSEKATNQTTLWLWMTEIGWVHVHPLLEEHGWKYVHANTWDKGVKHVAGRCNTQTMRMFPVVNEMCVHYVRDVKVNGNPFQKWLRSEWERSGLPFDKANEACGVKNAATRKYLAPDQWYAPPSESLLKIMEYANEHGDPGGRPYFDVGERSGITEWNEQTRKEMQSRWNVFLKENRAKFYCPIGVTNVWNHPPLVARERIKENGKNVHLNQKPLKIIKMLVNASSDKGDVIWEPFGGLCTVAIACRLLHRKCFSAEMDDDFYQMSTRRLKKGRLIT